MNKPFRIARNSLQQSQLKKILPKLFGVMDEDVFQEIEAYLEWIELLGDEYLFRQGDEGDSLYILVSGRLQATVENSGGGEQVIGEVSRGETVGEMAIFTGERRSAGIKAVRDSVLVKISKASFEQMISRFPAMVMNITKLVIERLKRHNHSEKVNYKVVNIAVVAITQGIDLEGFTARLIEKIKPENTVIHLSGSLVNQYLDEGGIAYVSRQNSEYYRRLSVWLDEQEACHDYLFYQADPHNSEWTKRCIRQADEILLVANAGEPPELSLIEKELLTGENRVTSANQTLVLVHPEKRFVKPQNTSDWLSGRQVKVHHHIKENDPVSFERLVRFLTGKTIGLVLGGGGAKGLAHIGVFRALEEARIPVDIIGGTSIGSMIGAMVAFGWDYEQLHNICRSIAMENPTNDFNFLPFVSILKGKKLDRLIMHLYSETNIEDLWLNYYCVSSNLTKTRAQIHRRGMLRKAVRASISLPGIFPPVLDGDNLLIDGGVFNNLPIDIMGEMGIGHIVAVDFDVVKKTHFTFEKMPSSWQLLKDRVFRAQARYQIPSFMSTIIQSTTLNSDSLSRRLRSDVDLFFNPDLTKYGLMDWKSYDKIVEVGYQHARKVIENWEGWQ